MVVLVVLASAVAVALAGVAFVGHRATARARAELEAQAAASRQLVLAMRTVLTTSTAVELTSLRGWARTLKRRDVDLPTDVAAEWASRIESGVDRLGSALAELALLAGLDAGVVELHRHPTDVAAVLTATLERAGLASSVKVTVPPGLEPPLVDPSHLATIVGALARGIPAPVEITGAHTDDGLVLTAEYGSPPVDDPDGISLRLVEGLARLHGGWLSRTETSDGHTSLRAALPDWPTDDEHNRVLVVDWAQECQWVDELHEPSYDVATCGGLDVDGGAEACPLIEHGHCPLVEAADVFVFNVVGDDTRALAVLHEYRRRAPATPLVIAVPVPLLDRYEELFPGCVVVPGPLDTSRAADLVSGSLRLAPERNSRHRDL